MERRGPGRDKHPFVPAAIPSFGNRLLIFFQQGIEETVMARIGE
jgi:hypothetical protein